MDDARGIPELLLELHARTAFVRQRAARALGTRSSLTENERSQIVAALLTALADSNKYVRLDVARVLARLAPQQSVGLQTLINLLQDAHRDVRASAALALGELGPLGQAAIPALREALHDPLPAVRQRVEDALRRLGELP